MKKSCFDKAKVGDILYFLSKAGRQYRYLIIPGKKPYGLFVRPLDENSVNDLYFPKSQYYLISKIVKAKNKND